MQNILTVLNVISTWLLGGEYFYSFQATTEMLMNFTPTGDGNLLGQISDLVGYLAQNANYIPSLIAWILLLSITLTLAIKVPYKIIRRFCRKITNTNKGDW